MNLINKVEDLIEQYLKNYLLTLHDYSVYSDDKTIYVTGKKNKDDTSDFYLLRLNVNIENEEFLIPTIFLPNEDRKKGIGLGLIAFIFEITKKLNFGLALVQMVDSFRDKMLERGAKETGIYDCLQITESTNLK
ncbi:hypothetical protein G1K97_13530 [Tenacibaculum finnmarkense]|uniref:hypothetical protein n=1 Tax=Tenacibaculum finnmarkense TaxID=2781243 RepID=UPI001EFB4738|nr:hypothetical protein [Tenacibaculum finnmarkense]MCG8902850.1 hypothetical protein [Tenacibaculum finnmarkense]